MKTASTDFRPFFDSKKSKSLNDQAFLKNGPTISKIDFENISDKDLYAYCKKVGFNARKWHRKFIATIPEVAKRRLYKKYGYCSIHEFAGKMAGVSHDNVDEVSRVSEKFKELPKMKVLIGEVGLSKLKVVACIATKDTDGFWAEKVKNMTKSSLEIYVKEIKRQDSVSVLDPVAIHTILQKFPGELIEKNQKIPQEQAQINMFDSEKSISQNANQASFSNIQNHDKKTFTIQIDEETEFELRKFKLQLEKERKEPVDWNSALKEMVRRAVNIKPDRCSKIVKEESAFEATKQTAKSTQASELRTFPEKSKSTVITRYIPAKNKRDIEQKYHSHCAYRGCNKPAEQIHHKDRFAITHSHDNLVPLCKNHHNFIHQNLKDPLNNKIDRIFNQFKLESRTAGPCGN